MTDSKPIKVLIVDDHPVVRDGLKNMLLAFDDLELIGEAENGQTALSFCRENAPDVILMDIIMPVM
ncbi:MAG: response regulator transcription factor, partial [Chloroflexota bacterium]